MGTLVTADELAARLEEPSLVIVDCRFNLMEPAAGRRQWQEGHIPGAHHADLDHDLAGPVTAQSGRHPLPSAEQLAQVLGRWGLNPNSNLVIYDADGGAIGARLWWLARWAGHDRVALLDGGFPAWQAAGHPVTQATTAEHKAIYPVRPGHWPVVTTEQVAKSVAAEGPLTLIDARAAGRFAGEVEPIDSKSGHIPGALNRPFTENLATGARFKSPAQLKAELSDLRVNGELVAMCGSGVTACHTLFAIEHAGLIKTAADRPGLYVGSWSEWIRSADRPIATGS